MYKKKVMRYIAGVLAAVTAAVWICFAGDIGLPLDIEVGALNEPYTMTSTYKSGKYYKNLASLSLSGDQARDVMAIALSQIGYHEGDSESDMHGVSTDGTRDFVEYNVLSGKYDNAQGNGLSYGYYWCASFVNWCLRMAGVSEAASGSEVSCQRWYADCKELEIFRSKTGYVPASGDIVFFRDDGSSASSTHVGLVRYSDGANVYTVEGNTSSGDDYSSDGEYVALKEYPLTSRYIVGYATPKYERADAAHAVDHSGGFLSLGKYISESRLELFSDSEMKIKQEDIIPEFSVFSVTSLCDGSMGVTYDGVVGYISLESPFIQLSTSETVYVTSYINDDGYMLFLPQYRRGGEAKSIYSNSPVIEDRGFVEWSSADGSLRLCAGDAIPDDVGDLTLLAVWDDKKYTVTFNYPDGTQIAQFEGYYGTEYSIPSPVVTEGQIFTGFDISPDGVIRGDATYTAVYVPVGELSSEETDTEVQTSPNMLGCNSSFSGAWFAFAATALWLVTFLNRKRVK